MRLIYAFFRRFQRQPDPRHGAVGSVMFMAFGDES